MGIQKQYTFELIDYVQWQKRIKQRRSCWGKFTYNFGKIIAFVWGVKVFNVNTIHNFSRQLKTSYTLTIETE